MLIPLQKRNGTSRTRLFIPQQKWQLLLRSALQLCEVQTVSKGRAFTTQLNNTAVWVFFCVSVWAHLYTCMHFYDLLPNTCTSYSCLCVCVCVCVCVSVNGGSVVWIMLFIIIQNSFSYMCYLCSDDNDRDYDDSNVEGLRIYVCGFKATCVSVRWPLVESLQLLATLIETIASCCRWELIVLIVVCDMIIGVLNLQKTSDFLKCSQYTNASIPPPRLSDLACGVQFCSVFQDGLISHWEHY